MNDDERDFGDEKDFGTLYPPGVTELTQPDVSKDTVALLETLLADAKRGKVTGMAVVVLRPYGEYALSLKGSAT